MLYNATDNNKKLHTLIFHFGDFDKTILSILFFNIRHLRCPSSCASNAACRPNLNGGNQFDIFVLFYSCIVFCRRVCLLVFSAGSLPPWQTVTQQAADCYFIHPFIFYPRLVGQFGYPKHHRSECVFSLWSSGQPLCAFLHFDAVAAVHRLYGQLQLSLF